MKYFTTLLMPMIWALFALAPNSFAQNTTAEYISQITPPAISDSIPVKDGDRFLTYQNGYLFIVNEWTGVQIAGVSDISAPRKTALLRTQDMAHQIDIDENRLYLAQENAGIDVYDISDIRNPRKISNIKTPGDAYWVDADYPYLYTALGNSGFCIMDVSKPDDPRTLSLEIPGNWIWSISHEGNRAYVAAKQGGLLIYDVTDPASPVKLTQYLTPDQVIQVQVEKNIAYIADGPGGLLILDVSAPGLIKELGHFATPGFSRHVFKSGNYAYLSNRENGLLIINVSDPAHPYLEGHYKPQSETYCSYKQDVYVFLATDTKTEILRHNNRPVLDPISDAVIDENSPYVLQLKAHDADGDSLFYEAENLPQGSQFDSTNGLFSWTPGWEQAGIYNGLVFRVIEKTGSRLTDADTINIRVNHIDRLPNLPAIANRDIREDSLLIIAVPQASDPDKEDAGKLTYHAENLPQGAQFNAATRTFQWKPTFDQSGTYVVDFVVDDGAGGADREAVTITVRHVDRPPHIQQIADQTIGEGQPLAIQLQGMEPDREDKDKIQFSMQRLPPGSAFDAATAQFNWTPGYDQSGVYPGVTAVMKAGALSDTTHFGITVNHVNRPPVLAKIPDQIVDENSALSFKISGSDPDAEDTGKLTYAAENLPAGAAFNADSLTFSWIPDYEQSGSYSNVLFMVKDPQGLTDQKSVNIMVNHVNRGPVLQNIPVLAVDENQDLRYQLIASDPDKEDAGKLSFSSPDLPKNAML
ncbi:MAG: putative Ig domain-containing protein, partial [Calditrichia bacterium]